MTTAPTRPAEVGTVFPVPAGPVVEALAQRLRATAQVLLTPGLAAAADAGADDAERAGSLLHHLVAELHPNPSIPGLWLLFTAVAAAFPDADELVEARRFFEHATPDEAAVYLLDACYIATRNGGTPTAHMDVVVERVLVDVDFCARNEHHTGIQRVVRETMPRWTRDHDLLLVAWTDAHGAMRPLTAHETERVLDWYGRQHRHRTARDSTAHDAVSSEVPEPAPHTESAGRLVVPWRSHIVLAENPEPQRCPSLAAVAQYSGNTVTAIGYDCIPAVSPELVHPGLPDRFMSYLSVVKHAEVIAGISASATAEFEGFAQMMPAQGLPGPRVVEVVLPVQVPPPDPAAEPSPSGLPLVLSVGSFEPRKNQLALLVAAERLWREGLAFELRFIGGGGWRTEFEALVNRLSHQGRDVSVAVQVSDLELQTAYRQARFTVFTSLHEGFGLPVAESLAYGVPALTTSYGSTAEIAVDGGALLVDPRDDEALVAQLRRMLTDDALVGRLRAAARARPVRSWDDYAAELWQALVVGPRPAEAA